MPTITLYADPDDPRTDAELRTLAARIAEAQWTVLPSHQVRRPTPQAQDRRPSVVIVIPPQAGGPPSLAGDFSGVLPPANPAPPNMPPHRLGEH